MVKLLALSSVVGVLVLGAPAVALAGGEGHDHGDGDHERGDDHDSDDHHGRAPEPVTVIGLALGAGVIGAARWAAKRKSR